MCIASRKRVRECDTDGDEDTPTQSQDGGCEHPSKRQKYAGEGWDRSYQAPTPPLSPKESLVAKKKRPSLLDKFEGFAAAVWLVDVMCCPQLCRDMLCYEVWRYYRPKPKILRCPRVRMAPMTRESENDPDTYSSHLTPSQGRKRVFSHDVAPPLPMGFYCHSFLGKVREERPPVEIESY